MNIEEYDILYPEDENVSYEVVGNSITSADDAKKSSDRSVDYNSFITSLLNNPSLTKQDRDRIVDLLLKERDKGFVTKEQVQKMIEDFIGKKRPISNHNKKLSPKSTADFLSLFNKKEGLKYLTHNYDNSTMTLEAMLDQAKSIFKEQTKVISIPKQLWTLINTFLNGGEWVDYKDSKCLDGYSNKNWLEWSVQNENRHPITDIGGMEQVIQRFRHTVRIVAPDMKTMMEEITKPFGETYNFELIHLEKADFYTHVSYIKHRIKEIIKDLADHSSYKDIKIEYLPGVEGDYHTRRFKITQVGSFSARGIDEVIERYNAGAGFFAENAEKLRGYCYWTVESLWDDKPYRWNILADTDTDTKEMIEKDSVDGFTHLLTFYHYDKE